MNSFHSTPSPYVFHQEGKFLILENDYHICVHDLGHGGELVEMRVKNGSNRNILVQNQYSSVSTVNGTSYYPYRSDRFPAENLQVSHKGDELTISFIQYLTDARGIRLPFLSIEKSITYHPWGYAEHRLIFHAEKRIDSLGQVETGSFAITPEFDYCALRASSDECGNAWGTNMAVLKPMFHGESRLDSPVHLSHHLPVAVILFRRGVEGVEFSLNDDLAAWDNFVSSQLHWQQAYICYFTNPDRYEVHLCPLDCPMPGQYIDKGDHTIGFRMSLPFVKRNIVPLRPCSGGLLQSKRGFEKRWPSEKDVAAWRKAGVTLMRCHNDGDSFANGIFWRDAAYPPYPPDEMKKMDDFLALCRKYQIAVVPYFSVKEFHPEAAGYTENFEQWARRSLPDSPVMTNGTRHGVFGTQMCLASRWSEKRRISIDETLAEHDFRGVYYDWCGGSECESRCHCSGRHWDNDELQQHLEWSHTRVGEDGEIYLHLTNVPSFAAENLATLVLTEEASFVNLNPEMFSPHVHFMNIAPRQICDMLPENSTATDRRKLALATLLHHATISSTHPDYLKFSEETAFLNSEAMNYFHHTAPGEGLVKTNVKQVGAALYWNDKEALLLAANMLEQTVTVEWEISEKVTGCCAKKGTLTLDPLELHTEKISIG